MCAGQILGLRLAIYGVKLLGIEDPEGKDRKRLVSFVEIDRCATDAVPIVTGCRMGKRALKFRDFGKVAATFCDLQAGRSVRVSPDAGGGIVRRAVGPGPAGSGRDAGL
jgi:formylmethanofuran dehydrogenase subunit E